MANRTKILGLVAAALALLPGVALAQSGEEVYKQRCAACHLIGGGKLVGPDLKGATTRHSEAWLFKYVKSPKALADSGDAVAIKLIKDYAPVVMPDQPVTDAEIRAIFAFVDSSSGVSGPTKPVVATSTSLVAMGQALYQGKTRFLKGGPACNSCHEVTNDAVIGGGGLGPDLTRVFSKGENLVRGMIKSPAVIMEAAYKGKELTDEEIAALVSFLKEANKDASIYQPRDYGINLFISGVVGVVLLMGFYSLLWRGRKRVSVNQAIFDRQVSSI